MVFNIAHRPVDVPGALDHLLADNDEEEQAKEAMRERAEAIKESLVAAGVLAEDLSVMADLQDDFALNQPLSTFALAALELLDKESETYAVDALSVLEATLEDPRQVLYAQQSKARGEAVAAMKAEGIEYDERVELVEEISWPKPLADLLEHAYTVYAEGHPWVLAHPLRPKSVAREMYEMAMTFVEYVGAYKLASSEGLVLRYLADAYKALRRTVPDDLRTETVDDITEWLGELVRQVDSSLLDEWEQLVNPQAEVSAGVVDTAPPPVTANVRAFRVLVRNAMFRRVELAALGRWEDLGALDGDDGWDGQRWQAAMQEYFSEYDELGTGPAARGPALLHIATKPGAWEVRQVFDDPAGDRDWGIAAVVDLAASDEAGEAVVRVVDVGSL